MNKIKKKAISYTSTVGIIDNGNIKKHILNSIGVAFALVAFFYVLILGSMVSNIIERKSLEVSFNNVSNEISSLELDYFAMSNSVDINLSESMGYHEVKPSFVTQKSFGSIKLAKNEI